jgi:hypothetical protein
MFDIKKLKQISASMFALILLCFFLPFITISCQGQDVMSMSGVQMATGVEYTKPYDSMGGAFGSISAAPKTQKIAGSLPVGIAFTAAAAGLASIFLLKGRMQKHLVPGIASGIGAILLLSIKSGTDDTILKQGGGMIQVSYGLGFYLALLLFVANAGMNGYLFNEERKQIK